MWYRDNDFFCSHFRHITLGREIEEEEEVDRVRVAGERERSDGFRSVCDGKAVNVTAK